MTAVAERLRIDEAAVTGQIAEALRRQVGQVLHRSGVVVAMSGGLDSSLCAALAARALGPDRVLGLALPERESAPDSLRLARAWAARLGIAFAVEEITPTLEGCGCYQRRDAAIRRLVPYGDGWRCKLVLDAGSPDSDRLPLCYLVAQSPEGDVTRVRLPAREFREIVAATSFKQRVRKMFEYYHADRLQYAVLGTANRLEHEMGFFVKGGDGLADVKPIAHLYKAQVSQLARYLDVPETILSRAPTTDTYSLPQTQQEFFYSLPLPEVDILLQALNQQRDAVSVAAELAIPPVAVERAFRGIDAKRRGARYLHLPPLLVEAEAVG